MIHVLDDLMREIRTQSFSEEYLQLKERNLIQSDTVHKLTAERQTERSHYFSLSKQIEQNTAISTLQLLFINTALTLTDMLTSTAADTATKTKTLKNMDKRFILYNSITTRW